MTIFFRDFDCNKTLNTSRTKQSDNANFRRVSVSLNGIIESDKVQSNPKYLEYCLWSILCSVQWVRRAGFHLWLSLQRVV